MLVFPLAWLAWLTSQPLTHQTKENPAKPAKKNQFHPSTWRRSFLPPLIGFHFFHLPRGIGPLGAAFTHFAKREVAAATHFINKLIPLIACLPSSLRSFHSLFYSFCSSDCFLCVVFGCVFFFERSYWLGHKPITHSQRNNPPHKSINPTAAYKGSPSLKQKR